MILRRHRESVTVVELMAYLGKIDAPPGAAALAKADMIRVIGEYLDMFVDDPRPETAEFAPP